MRVIFMGSGDFAIPTLQKLITHHEIAAVFTTEGIADRKAKQVVSELATKQSLPLFKPSKLTPEIINDITLMDADIIVVVSYGLILPKTLLTVTKFTPINVHPSLLPRFRGAAPIERCLESGDTESAVCIIEVAPKLDSGNIVALYNFKIDKKTSSRELTPMCASIGADLVIETLDYCQKNNALPPSSLQSEEGLTYAKKIDKSEFALSFSDDITTVFNKIRAFNNLGGCYFILNGKERVKILNAEYSLSKSATPGKIDPFNGQIHFTGGILIPILLQREGKKEMPAKDFWRGVRIG